MSSLGTLAMTLKLNIDGFSTKLKQVEEDIESTQEKMSGFKTVGDEFTKVGSSLTLGVTVPIVAAGGASVKFASDMETSMSKIGTISDSTQVPIDALKKAIIDMSNESGESASILAEGMYDAISSGVQTGEAVEFLSIALKDAKGGFTDTATAVDGLTSVLNGYGLETKDALEISNQMMIAQNLGKTTFGEMASVMGNIVPTANALKVESKELFSSMAVLTANGIKTSESVTGLKSAFSNIIKPTKDAQDAANALGIDFTTSAVATKGWKGFLVDLKDKLAESAPEYAKLLDRQAQLKASMNSLEKEGKKGSDEYKAMSAELKGVDGNMEILAKSSDSTIASFGTMFGSVEALNTVLTLTTTQGMSLYDESMQQMGSGTDYVNQAYETMNNNTSANFAKTKETFKNTLAELGVQLLPMVNKGLEVIRDLMVGFNNLSPSVKNVIMIVAGSLAVIGPTLLVIGKFAFAINSISTSITAFKGAINVVKGLKIVSSLGSVTSVFAKLKGAMSLTSILPLITGPVGITIAVLAGLIAIGVAVYKNWDTIKETGAKVGQSIKESWNGTVEKCKGFFKDLSSDASEKWQETKDNAKKNMDKLKEDITTPINNATNFVGQKWEDIKKGTSEKWGQTKDFAKEHMIALATAIASPIAGIVSFTVKNWEDIKAKTSEKWGQTKDFAKNSMDKLSTNIITPLSNIGKNIGNKWNDIKTITSAKFDDMKQAIFDSFDKIKNDVPGKLNAIKGVFNTGFKFLSDLKSAAITWGKDMVDGFVQGIKNSIGKVTDAVKGVASKVTSYLHFSTPDEGPLAEYETWMPDFMDGLASGIKNNSGKVLGSISDLASSMNISSKLVLQPAVATSTSSQSTLSSQQVGGYTNNAPIMQVENLYVRNDSDVNNISRSIYNENMKVIRALGKR